MLIAFKNMPDYARVWVYQADRSLIDSEIAFLERSLQYQIKDWAAHGAPLAGGFEILHNRFVLIAADEMQNATSGCSIDASTNWLKTYGLQLNINFFDRSIAYLSDNEIHIAQLLDLKKVVSDQRIVPDTIIFNNLINNIGALKTNWKIKASESWLKKYFTNEFA